MSPETITRTDLLDKYIDTAKSKGVPQDQLKRFIEAGHIATPKGLELHAAARAADHPDGPIWILFGGSRGGAKSHHELAQVGLDDCQRAPGIKVLYLRKVQKAAGESIDDLVPKIFAHIDHDFASSAGRITFPNGSRIVIGGFKDASDIDKYIGVNYDAAIIEEVTQLTEEKIIKIRGSIRSSRPDFRTRIYLSTNAGGPGHGTIKREFIIPWRNKRDNSFIGGRVMFIPSNYKDNPYNRQEYVEYLEALPGQIGKAWRDGDWDAFMGMAFPRWDAERHIIDPILIPKYWPKWRAVDWGSAAPFCALWLTNPPGTKRVYVYRELYIVGLTDKEQAQAINRMTPGDEQISYTYADPSMWAKSSHAGEWKSTADIYAENGVPLTRANNERIQGKRTVERYLADLPDERPGVQIFRTCYNLTEELPNLPLSQTNVEDVDTDADDHAYDALRYGLTREVIAYKREQQQALRSNQAPIALVEGL